MNNLPENKGYQLESIISTLFQMGYSVDTDKKGIKLVLSDFNLHLYNPKAVNTFAYILKNNNKIYSQIYLKDIVVGKYHNFDKVLATAINSVPDEPIYIKAVESQRAFESLYNQNKNLTKVMSFEEMCISMEDWHKQFKNSLKLQNYKMPISNLRQQMEKNILSNYSSLDLAPISKANEIYKLAEVLKENNTINYKQLFNFMYDGVLQNIGKSIYNGKYNIIQLKNDAYNTFLSKQKQQDEEKEWQNYFKNKKRKLQNEIFEIERHIKHRKSNTVKHRNRESIELEK